MIVKDKGLGMKMLMDTLPYPDQIDDIDLSKENSIYFKWRSARYKFGLLHCSVEKVDGIFLHGDDCSTLMEAMLRKRLKEITT